MFSVTGVVRIWNSAAYHYTPASDEAGFFMRFLGTGDMAGCHHGQLIGALIIFMAVMAAHPVPAYRMARRRLFQPLPEIAVLHRLFVSGFPAARFPAPDPLRDAFLHIRAIGVEIDAAWAFKRFQRGNGRHHFHAVIGAVGLAAGKLFFRPAIHQYGAPPPRAGIAGAGTVRVNAHVFLRHRPRPH